MGAHSLPITPMMREILERRSLGLAGDAELFKGGAAEHIHRMAMRTAESIPVIGNFGSASCTSLKLVTNRTNAIGFDNNTSCHRDFRSRQFFKIEIVHFSLIIHLSDDGSITFSLASEVHLSASFDR